MADKFEYSDEQLKSLLAGIYADEITQYDLPVDLYEAIVKQLTSGLYKGYGGNLADFEGKDLELLNELRESVYMFSAAKTYQEVGTIRDLMFDSNGDLVGQREFNQLGAATSENWNDNWGSTEYNTTIQQAQTASKWNEIEKNKDLLPYVQFQTTGGGNVCEICAPLDGLTARVDDPIWDEATPCLHFNDECIIIQLGEDEATESSKEEIDNIQSHIDDKVSDVFRMNPAKDGYIFSDAHPYFQVAEKDAAFAKNNFGLPLPESD